MDQDIISHTSRVTFGHTTAPSEAFYPPTKFHYLVFNMRTYQRFLNVFCTLFGLGVFYTFVQFARHDFQGDLWVTLVPRLWLPTGVIFTVYIVYHYLMGIVFNGVIGGMSLKSFMVTPLIFSVDKFWRIFNAYTTGFSEKRLTIPTVGYMLSDGCGISDVSFYSSTTSNDLRFTNLNHYYSLLMK